MQKVASNNICLQLKQCSYNYVASVEFYNSKRSLRKLISHLDSAWEMTQTENNLNQLYQIQILFLSPHSIIGYTTLP